MTKDALRLSNHAPRSRCSLWCPRAALPRERAEGACGSLSACVIGRAPLSRARGAQRRERPGSPRAPRPFSPPGPGRSTGRNGPTGRSVSEHRRSRVREALRGDHDVGVVSTAARASSAAVETAVSNAPDSRSDITRARAGVLSTTRSRFCVDDTVHPCAVAHPTAQYLLSRWASARRFLTESSLDGNSTGSAESAPPTYIRPAR